MNKHILVLNAGSSSLKFSLFDTHDISLQFHGQVEDVWGASKLIIQIQTNKQLFEKAISKVGYSPAIIEILQWLTEHNKKSQIIGAGHRIVHGGKKFIHSEIISPSIIKEMKLLIPLAPLHQPYSIEVIETLAILQPEIKQIACFDTAFHKNQPMEAQLFALPLSYAKEGIIRYGFHGLSYEYITSVLPEYLGENAHNKIIVAHLGNGASMCAMDNLHSVATTMGFTTLDGLIMGTRCGNIDPGVILYLLETKGLSIKEITNLLYNDSGLKGISGLSHDMRDLLASDMQEAKIAIELFCYYAAKQLAGLIPALKGLEAIVFTAGIGENSPAIRKNICERLAWFGVKLSEDLNNANQAQIHSLDSKIEVYVIPTNEEKIIAFETNKILS